MSYKEIEEKIKQYIPNSDLTILEYNGFNHKITYKCNKCGQVDYRNEYRTLIRTKYGCKKCLDGIQKKSSTQLKVEQLLQENLNIDLVQWNGVNNRAKLYCNNCKQFFYRYPAHILKNNDYCPNCSIVKSRTPRTLEEAQEALNNYAGNTEFKILKFKNSSEKALVQHTCGFIFERKLWNFSISRGCPKCQGKRSILEKKVRAYLNILGVNFSEQVHFRDCNNGYSSFDFAIKTNKQLYLIEVQGQQHYHQIPGFDDYEIQQQRDELKREYCKKKGIPLIEIPYYDIDKLDNYFSFLKSPTTISKESRAEQPEADKP